MTATKNSLKRRENTSIESNGSEYVFLFRKNRGKTTKFLKIPKIQDLERFLKIFEELSVLNILKSWFMGCVLWVLGPVFFATSVRVWLYAQPFHSFVC